MSDLAAQLDASERDRGQTAFGRRGHVIGNLANAGKVHYRPIAMLIVSGIVLIAAIVIGTTITVLNLRDSALVNSERELGNTALLIAKHADHEIEELDAIQNSLIEEMRSLGDVSSEGFDRKMSGLDVHLILKHKISGLSHIGSVALINSNGMLTNTSLEWPIPAINVTDRNYFQAFKLDAQLTSFVSEPIRGRRTGNWTIVFARKISAPDGKFLGVVRGTIDLQYFENFFGSVILGEESSTSLYHNDGTLLVRNPRIQPIVGNVFKGAIDALGERERATTRLVGKMDGKDRLLAAQRLEHFPLFISVGVDVAAVLANWQKEVIVLVGLGGLAVLMIAAMIFIIARQLLRGKKQFQLKFDAQKLQLNTAFSNISQGLVMFDSAARLVVCNDRYRQIYDLPPDLTKPGCAVVDLLQHSAANGTFSGNPEKYVGDLLATIAQGKIAKQEIEIDDGRIICVVNQPMADGGWVATHEDITEQRKIIQERDRDREFLNKIVNNVPATILVKDASNRRYVLINQAGEEYFGISRDQIIGKTAQEVWPKATADVINGHDEQLLQSDGYLFFDEHLVDTPGNGSRFVTSKRLVIRDGKGEPQYLVGVIEDVTERKRTADELRRTKKFFDTVIEHIPLPIIVKDVAGLEADACGSRFTLFNRAYEELTGESRIQSIGKTAHQLFPKERADLIVQADNEALQSDQMVLTSEHPILTSHNGTRLVKAQKTVIRDEYGKPQYLLTVVDDVTERNRAEKRIAHMAHHDTLTDLPNRAAFNECLSFTLDQAATTREHFAIMSIDLDRFKEINDVFGHAVGDALLVEVARRLQAAAGAAFLARIGGDEFTLIVADGPQPETASALGDCLLAAVADDFDVEGHRLRIDLSIGVAIYPTDGADAKTLMNNADAALYRAKAETRGSVLFFAPEMDMRLRERLSLQNDLRLAIDRGELFLHYQPQMRMAGGTIGFEALARWQCPKRGMVAPGMFIPIAEESSLIISVGEWVLREACREAASWPQPLQIAVNVSPIQFRHGDLPRVVHSILLETGLSPNRLELEITEGVLINDFSRAVSILRRLKSLGVRIAMDDFGTGYSSLSYLQSFSFDKIKIDRTFVSDLEHNRNSMAIVRAVISLGRSLDLPVLAEGVETKAQHAFLLQEGCDEVQGYLTGRPLPIADYAKLVGRQTIALKNYAVAD